MCGYTCSLLFSFFFLSAVEFLKQVAVCPGCMGTEDLEEDLNVDDDEQHGSPESSVHSPPGLTAQTLRRHGRQQQQHQQPQQHHHHQHQHQQQPLVPPDRRRRKVGSVASGMSGRRMEWDVESAPELCTECPNVELITMEWLPGSDHNVTGFGPRQVCVPVPLPLPLAIPFHNRVYVCFQRHSAKAESEADAEATEAKEAEDEQTVCGRVAVVCPVVLMQNSCRCVSRATPTKEKQKQQRQKRLRTNRWYVAGSLLFSPVVLMQNSVRLCFQGHAPEGADAEAEGAAMDAEQKVCVMVTWTPSWVVLAVALLHYCVCVCFQGHAADGAAAETGAEADREQENKEEAETDPESKEKAQVGPTSCVCRNRGTHVPPNCTRCTPTF